MTINLFANVINEDAIAALTPAQLDQVNAMFDKPEPKVAPIDPEAIERAKDAALAIIAEYKEA